MNRETYPVGAALSLSSARQLAMNEQRMPPFPLLFLLAPDGNLVSFYTTNTTPGAPQLTTPPQPIGAAGERKGNVVVPSAPAVPKAAAIPPSQMSKVADTIQGSNSKYFMNFGHIF